MTTYCVCEICKGSPMKTNGNENGVAEIAAIKEYQLPEGFELFHFSNQLFPSLMSRELVEFDASVSIKIVSQDHRSAIGVSTSAPPAVASSEAQISTMSDNRESAAKKHHVCLFCFAYPRAHDFKGQAPKKLRLTHDIGPYPYIYRISREKLDNSDGVSVHECRISEMAAEQKNPQVVILIDCGGHLKIKVTDPNSYANEVRDHKLLLRTKQSEFPPGLRVAAASITPISTVLALDTPSRCTKRDFEAARIVRGVIGSEVLPVVPNGGA